jgi:hypothetical protein
MDSTAENEKRKHDGNSRTFYPLFPVVRFVGGLVLLFLLNGIVMVFQDSLPAALIIGGILLVYLPEWVIIFMGLRQDRLTLSSTGIKWSYEKRQGETAWENLTTLAQNPAGEFDNRYGIRLHQPVQLTLQGEPVQEFSEFIPLSRYARRTESHMADFFFRRTLLGEALYRKAPQIFAGLEEQEKHMGFARYNMKQTGNS